MEVAEARAWLDVAWAMRVIGLPWQMRPVPRLPPPHTPRTARLRVTSGRARSGTALPRRPMRPLPRPSEVTLFTAPSWPASVFRHMPLLTLQMRIVLSDEALAITPLSGPSEATLKT